MSAAAMARAAWDGVCVLGALAILGASLLGMILVPLVRWGLMGLGVVSALQIAGVLP